MAKNRDIIPVLMFHSIGLESSTWIYSKISEPISDFDDKVKHLVSSGYTFVNWDQLFDHMQGKTRLPSKSIMLTFDDGYLDNWVYAYPILKRYGAKATIFVTPDFVDTAKNNRPNTDHTPDILPEDATGFLNWSEMREMEKSGLIDIQSHSLTHTWYFSSPDIVDFHTPGNRQYPWLAWNSFPMYKPQYMNKGYDDIIPLGTPIFKHTKSLGCRRYFPSEKISQGLIKFVQNNGGDSFFNNPGWKAQLFDVASQLSNRYNNEGWYESDHEYESRVFNELSRSKHIIEENLDKEVHYICWPGGAYNQKVISLAQKAGYRSWTLGSSDRSGFRNTFSSNPNQIARIGPFHKYVWKRKGLAPAGHKYFIYRVNHHRGLFIQGALAKVLLLIAVLKHKVFRFNRG